MSQIDLSSLARTLREAPAVPFRRTVAVGVRIDGRLVCSELLYGEGPPRSSQNPPRLSGRTRFPIYSIVPQIGTCSEARMWTPLSSFATGCRFPAHERSR